MKNILKSVVAFALAVSFINSNAQSKTTESVKSKIPVSKPLVKPEPITDKIDTMQKGPNGETVYSASTGGSYYISKSGNKAYLSQKDTLVYPDSTKTDVKTTTKKPETK